ncbi:MAG TPA: FAD-dependent oxidoreductase [Amycolatopsis sp.]|uniref:FAD-dependent oxidoreductase n=1 Tax=Amycolatopsis sp. TaxID=37632 RepID=UPI002B4A0753|nr:FAD-dependent oxidoreductase [Amycolatopsis sp.]HKS49821.1 FAD-dependent oxidoreductase [Amycolatopsis sp.]
MAGVEGRPLRVALVGSGPAGMYAAGHLLEGPAGTYADGRLVDLVDRPVEVDVFDRLPTPWGLVRGGVAPDHPDKKLVAKIFEATAARPGFRFFGNVEVGREIRHGDLTEWYDAVIYAVGAAGDRRLGIPGEDLRGCWSAREFVAWYNGHPDFSHLPFDLSCERAVIVGNGNVALDVARVLALDVDALRTTDVADHALEALGASAIREIVILGRRDPSHAAFNNPELDELADLPTADVIVDPADLPGEHQLALAAADWTALRKIQTLGRIAGRTPVGRSRRIVLRFFTSPIGLVGSNRIESVLVARTELDRGPDGRLVVRATDDKTVIHAGLAFRAVGYSGAAIPGLPFDEGRGVMPNSDGRVIQRDEVLAGTYVAGWIKRGPSGIIGTNKKCARDTVRSLIADADAGRLPTASTLSANVVADLVRARQPAVVTFAGWKAIDRHERDAGKVAGRPRVKQTSIQRMVELAQGGMR